MLLQLPLWRRARTADVSTGQRRPVRYLLTGTLPAGNLEAGAWEGAREFEVSALTAGLPNGAPRGGAERTEAVELRSVDHTESHDRLDAVVRACVEPPNDRHSQRRLR